MYVLNQTQLGKKVKNIRKVGGKSEVYSRIQDDSQVISVLSSGMFDNLGREVFEGDILASTHAHLNEILFTCVYESGSFYLLGDGGKIGLYLKEGLSTGWVVVGNCFEPIDFLQDKAKLVLKEGGFVE